jgi:hypothetical protein
MENDADEMAASLFPLRQPAHESGCTMLLVHHRHTSRPDPGTAARGCSAGTDGVDVVMTLDHHPGPARVADDGIRACELRTTSIAAQVPAIIRLSMLQGHEP